MQKQKRENQAAKARLDETMKLEKEKKKVKNPESTQHIALKFMKQFDNVIEKMAEQEDWDSSQLVSFQQAGSILATMGFLPEKVTPEHPDYALFEEIWELMEGTAREGVRVEDLAYILKVIRGYRDSEIEVECEAPGDRPGIFKMVIFTEDGDFCIRKGG